MTMRSIRGKFLQLNLISILLCVALIGGLGLWSVSVIQRDSSKEILNLTCRLEGIQLNETLDSIKESVDLFCAMTVNQLPSLESLKDLKYVNSFVRDAEKNMTEIARITRGVCCYYFRIAPEMTEHSQGFLYGKRHLTGRMMKEPLTNLALYDPSDIEHVGWYYEPQAAGRSLWMKPYYNRNLGIYMVSYVVPLYRDGVFWGVAGMDIDFDVVIEHVRSIRPYKNSYAFLCDDRGMILYHQELEPGTNLIDYSPELAPLVDAFGWETAVEDHPVFQYYYKGVGKTMTFFRLNNSMELLLCAVNSEIKAPMVALFRVIVMVAMLLCSAAVVMIIPITNRITRPLELLTQAAKKIALGDLNVELPRPGNDEVGILSRSFEVTVSSLRQFVENMNDIAFTDPLTHVKNKTAYNRAILALNEDMARGQAKFGLVMFDLNDLKHINDTYGHEHGDEYIINSCRLICQVFKHSPVYRIGGDEFVVLLDGSELENCDARIAELNTAIEATASAENPWQRLSIAKGAACSAPGDTAPEDVFVRADRAMYADKRRMKEAAAAK